MTYSQSDFFNLIKSTVPNYHNVAQSIADVLEISINEAYKKIRGTSSLSFQQLLRLCDYFQTPFTYIPNGSPTVTFELPVINTERPDMLSYLQD